MILTNNMRTNTKGFTLIELLVVISIIGLLSSIVLISVSSARDKATAVSISQEFVQLRNALEMYRLANGTVPSQMMYDNDGSIIGGAVGVPASGIPASDVSGSASFRNVLSPLVAQNFISSIGDAPGYPNNSPVGRSIYFAYITNDAADWNIKAGNGSYRTCDSTPFGTYVLKLFVQSGTANAKNIAMAQSSGLPHMHLINYDSSGNITSDTTYPNIYCITDH